MNLKEDERSVFSKVDAVRDTIQIDGWRFEMMHKSLCLVLQVTGCQVAANPFVSTATHCFHLVFLFNLLDFFVASVLHSRKIAVFFHDLSRDSTYFYQTDPNSNANILTLYAAHASWTGRTGTLPWRNQWHHRLCRLCWRATEWKQIGWRDLMPLPSWKTNIAAPLPRPRFFEDDFSFFSKGRYIAVPWMVSNLVKSKLIELW